MSKTASDEGIDAEIAALEAKLRKHGDNATGAEINRLHIKKQDLQIRAFKREMARIAKMKAKP